MTIWIALISAMAILKGVSALFAKADHLAEEYARKGRTNSVAFYVRQLRSIHGEAQLTEAARLAGTLEVKS